MVRMTNRIVTKDFFEKTINIIAQNTSFSYSAIALNGIKGQLSNKFKFSKNINIKGRTVEVNKAIDNVSKTELRKFFAKVIDMVGPNYIKMLLAQRLNPKSLIYLENIGLRFD